MDRIAPNDREEVRDGAVGQAEVRFTEETRTQSIQAEAQRSYRQAKADTQQHPDRNGNAVYCTSACWGEHSGPCVYRPGTEAARRQDRIYGV